ncbi:MAG: alpha/beta hydrolase [Sphingobacteriales bacterium]|nr:MAG: alpha/beta hydrolase [Sphingobacteriales bacterium]
MNWKLKLMLWFVNNVQPMREVDGLDINKERKKNINLSKLGSFLYDSKTPIKYIENTIFDGIPVRIYKNTEQKNLKVIIYFHGGGYVFYNIDSHDYVTRRLCGMNNCTVISVDYRLAPEHTFPSAQEDGYKIVEYVHQHAEKLGIDPNKIIVSGDSAGATISACVAHHFKTHPTIKLAAQVLVYPWVDGKVKSASIEKYKEGYLLTKEAILWFQKKYVPNPEDRLKPECSPIYNEDFKNLPPAFVITAEYDPLKDEGKAYADKLQQAGNVVLYKDYKGLIHAFFNTPKVDEQGMQCFKDIQAFLKNI